MRALIQRVLEARCAVASETVGEIDQGLLIFLGIRESDDEETLEWMVNKCAQLRVFEDEEGKMNRALLDLQKSALVVSQFTLYGDCRKGNRPSFIEAAPPAFAEPMYERFCEKLEKRLGRPVARGRFGADMKIHLVNDGPVTIWIDRERERA